MAKSDDGRKPDGVSPAQRAALAELRKFELALLDAGSSFDRWVVSCAQASGVLTISLGSNDVTTLRLLACSSRRKRASEISFALNIEDIHIVTYSLKKLAKGNYVDSVKVGKELLFAATDTGLAFLEAYDRVRVSLILDTENAITDGKTDLAKMAQVLRAISSAYEQAARVAQTL